MEESCVKIYVTGNCCIIVEAGEASMKFTGQAIRKGGLEVLNKD